MLPFVGRAQQLGKTPHSVVLAPPAAARQALGRFTAKAWGKLYRALAGQGRGIAPADR
ncbi:MAG: hypothetical protein KME26_05260 [Oscillatoria princeps RMCB-10]|nr:hypothetical protein [Oscillatoria princeps RMCB-10]